MRNANAAYNASCANGTGADADLQRVRDTGKIARGFLRYDIADNELRSHLAFHFARRSNNPRRVSMRAIYKNNRCPRFGKSGRPLYVVRPDCGSNCNSGSLDFFDHLYLLIKRAISVQNGHAAEFT